MKKYFFIHPLIYAILPTLLLYKLNISEAWPALIVRPMIYSLFFGIASWIVFKLLLRDNHKTSTMTSVWLLSFFSYGHLYLFLANKGFFELLPIGPHLFLLGSYLLVLNISFLGLYFTKLKVNSLTAFFNVSALTLLLLNIIPLFPLEFKRIIALEKLHEYMAEQHLKDAEYSNMDEATYPDIYYLVFDRYPSHEIAKTYFNYDNQEFLENLTDKGFFVANDARANYPSSFQSISSSLNMSHLTFIKDLVGQDYSDQTIVYKELLNDNEVAQFLIDKGYNYYQLGSNWEPTKQNSLAINYNKYLGFNEFESFLYENTLLNAVKGKISGQATFTGVDILNIHQKNMPYKVDKIKEISKDKGTKFVFAHFLLPHPPYLFANDCTPLTFDEVRKRPDEYAYTEQIKCADKVMEEMAQEIIENDDRPIAIIFQSDEGPYMPYKYFKNEYQLVDTENNDAYKIKAGILNTFYLSNKDSNEEVVNYDEIGIKEDNTPVNTFRTIFNYYFGTDYSMEENNTYIFGDNYRPYLLEPILDKI